MRLQRLQSLIDIFDIAVPRDIDISYYDNISVYAVDDLESIVKSNLNLREEQAGVAYAIVGEMTAEFLSGVHHKIALQLLKH